MIYFTTTDGQAILVLEPGNIIDLKAGDVVVSPDKNVVIAYTKDILFFNKKLQESIIKNGKTFDAVEFDRIHKESMERPEVVERPYHNHKRFI